MNKEKLDYIMDIADALMNTYPNEKYPNCSTCIPDKDDELWFFPEGCTVETKDTAKRVIIRIEIDHKGTTRT